MRITPTPLIGFEYIAKEVTPELLHQAITRDEHFLVHQWYVNSHWLSKTFTELNPHVVVCFPRLLQ